MHFLHIVQKNKKLAETILALFNQENDMHAFRQLITKITYMKKVFNKIISK